LTREEEISLAKRIEEAEMKFAEALFKTYFARKEAIAMINAVLKKKSMRKTSLKTSSSAVAVWLRILLRFSRKYAIQELVLIFPPKSIAEFKLTSTVNEEIVVKITEIIESIERIDRILRAKEML